MNKILLNGDNFECRENSLPLLIHGEDKAGASLYTITYAANLFASGSTLLFLTGFEMAKEEFKKQTGESFVNDDRVIFCVKEEVDKFIQFVTTSPESNERVIIIKNIELFDEDIFNLISDKHKIIISGDINKCTFKDKILNTGFETKVIFSKIEEIETPDLQKYEGFLIGERASGITTVGVI